MKQHDEYAVAIADAIMTLFKDEEHGGNLDYHFNLSEIDATDFFTSVVTGCNLIFNSFTGTEKSNLEFTYLLNQLVVQDLINTAQEEGKP